MMRPGLCLLGLAALVAAGGAAYQPKQNALDQWPHWRGPLVNGVSPNGNPPLHWDEKTNLKWKVRLPGDKGSATPIVWGDHVFVAAVVDTGRAAKPEDMPKSQGKSAQKTNSPKTFHRFMLVCFDRQTGKERWRQICTERVPHEGHQPTHSYAAGSPTTDGKHVWVSFGSRGVYCYDFQGKLRWERDLGLFYSRSGFGEASTPVLHGDDLILNWDQDGDSMLVVLNAGTGQMRLQVPRDEPTTWNTPLVVQSNGTTQVILNGTKRTRGHDLATGKVLWEANGTTLNAIPSAVAADGVAYLMAGYGGTMALAVPLDARGDLLADKKVLWTHTKGTPYVPSPLLAAGKLYFTQANGNLLTCLEAKTGKPIFERVRLEGVKDFYASPMAAAGRIYMVDRDGVGLVLKLSDTVEILATNRLADNIDASPVAVGRQLFLRGHKYLYCIEEPSNEAGSP